MSKPKMIYFVIPCILPLVMVYLKRSMMNPVDYAMFCMVYCVQLVCMAVFFATKHRWGEWLVHRASLLDIDPEICPVQLAIDIFYTTYMLLFGMFLPVALDQVTPITPTVMLLFLIFALDTWYLLFLSPFHRILTADPKERGRAWLTPYLSLCATLTFLFVRPTPFDNRTTTLFVTTLFFIDILLQLGIRLWVVGRDAQ